MKPFWKIVFASFFIFFFSWLIVYKTGVNKLAIQSEDTLPAMFLPVTIIKEGTFYVDTYYEMIRAKYPHPDDKSFEKNLTPFYWRKAGDHYISAFPIMSGLLAVPVYFLPLVLGVAPTFENITILAHASASLIVAFSGGFMYLLLKDAFELSDEKAKLLIAIYLFGTVNFALISQALWQHGTLQLFIILSLLFLYKKRWFWASVMLGFGVLSRPTAVVMFPFLGLLGVLQFFRGAQFLGQPSKPWLLGRCIATSLQVVGGMLGPLFFFLWYNKTYYLDISNQGYSNQLLYGWLSRFPEGFLGLWLSPSKGILVYSPVFLFSCVGLYLALKKGLSPRTADFILFFCIIIAQTMLLGRWKHWYGGWSFGYRMASDIIPFLVLLLVPFVESAYFEKFKIWFFGLFIFSAAVQVFGLIFFDGIWHAAYDAGFVDTRWLWSLRDSEFAFNIRRVLVKLGILERACPKCSPN